MVDVAKSRPARTRRLTDVAPGFIASSEFWMHWRATASLMSLPVKRFGGMVRSLSYPEHYAAASK